MKQDKLPKGTARGFKEGKDLFLTGSGRQTLIPFTSLIAIFASLSSKLMTAASIESTDVPDMSPIAFVLFMLQVCRFP